MSALWNENQLSREIIGAAIEVHRLLGGPGLLESVYEEALVFELQARKLHIKRQVLVPLHYKGQKLSNHLRLDLLVHDLIIVECKAVELHNAVYEAQVLTYLRLTRLRLGLVINFGAPLIRDGVYRIVNGFEP